MRSERYQIFPDGRAHWSRIRALSKGSDQMVDPREHLMLPCKSFCYQTDSCAEPDHLSYTYAVNPRMTQMPLLMMGHSLSPVPTDLRRILLCSRRSDSQSLLGLGGALMLWRCWIRVPQKTSRHQSLWEVFGHDCSCRVVEVQKSLQNEVFETEQTMTIHLDIDPSLDKHKS